MRVFLDYQKMSKILICQINVKYYIVFFYNLIWQLLTNLAFFDYSKLVSLKICILLK